MNKRIILMFLFLAFLLRIIVAPIYWHPDVNNHVDWGERFFEYTPSKVYDHSSNVWSYTWPNQPPGTMYIFAFMHKLYLMIFALIWFLNIKISLFPSFIMPFFEFQFKYLIMKIPSILADFGLAFLIYRILKFFKVSEKKSLVATFIFLLNPAVWYNSSVWGQTDSIISFLFLLGVYFLFKNKLFLSILLIALSIYVKISLLIFIPVIVIYVYKNFKFIKILNSVLLVFIVIGFCTLPFSFSNSDPYSYLFLIYSERVLTQQLHLITANAFNFWAFATGIDQKSDSLSVFKVTYAFWGYLIFLTLYVLILIRSFKQITEKKLLWILSLIAFSSFVFLTNMHERYLYPLFPYLAIISFVNKKKFVIKIYFIVSLIYLLNMYNIWWTPSIDIIKIFLMSFDQIIPRVLGLIMTILFFIYLNKYLKEYKNL